jgi:hypothetical protein
VRTDGFFQSQQVSGTAVVSNRELGFELEIQSLKFACGRFLTYDVRDLEVVKVAFNSRDKILTKYGHATKDGHSILAAFASRPQFLALFERHFSLIQLIGHARMLHAIWQFRCITVLGSRAKGTKCRFE